MTNTRFELTRRAVLAGLGAAGLVAALRPAPAASADAAILTRAFPKTGELVPAIGMG